LPIDILREVKVDVILSTQSITNLESKIGKLKTKELLANLTTKVYLKGQDSDVKKGYFKINDESNSYKLTPLFISREEWFEAEYEYQKLIKLRKKLKLLKVPRKKGIFIHSPYFDNYTLIFEDKDGNREFVKYLTKDYIKDCDNGKEFLQSIKKVIKPQELEFNNQTIQNMASKLEEIIDDEEYFEKAKK
jgi:hypothetical protein